MELSSPTFAPRGEIPVRHTCEGEDVAPSLQWRGVPDRAASLVLIVDDPDAPDPAAPQRTWVHWVLFNIPPAASGLPEGGRPLPVGRHRYVVKLYALDKMLPALPRPSKAAVEQAMRGHVLAQAELIGTYLQLRS